MLAYTIGELGLLWSFIGCFGPKDQPKAQKGNSNQEK